MTEKSELRRILRVKRNAFVQGLSDAERRIVFSRLPSPLAAILNPLHIVAGYCAMGSEADPMAFMQQAAEMDCALALPHVQSKAQPMRFLSWTWGEPWVEGAFGLHQPSSSNPPVRPDVVLVPLVGFDRAGNRLGQGAGHYDRALSVLPDAIRIGIAYSCQEIDALPADPWDEPLHAICTEKEWIVP